MAFFSIALFVGEGIALQYCTNNSRDRIKVEFNTTKNILKTLALFSNQKQDKCDRQIFRGHLRSPGKKIFNHWKNRRVTECTL